MLITTYAPQHTSEVVTTVSPLPPALIEGEPGLRVLFLEDMIADRMGQYASGSARDMIDQARALLPLVSKADRDYLEQRIRTEALGDYGIEDLGE